MVPTELLVIGCRAGSPGSCGAASGYVLRRAGSTLLIDCGPGVVAGLASRDLLTDLDGVIITHTHADHCADLVALAYHRLFPRRMPPIPLFGPPGLEGVIEQVDQAFGIPTLPELRAPIAQALAFTPLSAGSAQQVLGYTVQTFVMRHPVETHALRFTELDLTYTADGAYTPALVQFAQGSKVLLAEATYLDDEGRDLDGHGHMTARLAGQLARDANVGRLIVTHFADCADQEPIRAEAERTFGRPVTAATPGLCFQLA